MFVRICVCLPLCVCVLLSLSLTGIVLQEERLAYTDMQRLSLPQRPCPFNPGWQWAASHMAWASCIWRRAGKGKTRITTTHRYVCVCGWVCGEEVCSRYISQPNTWWTMFVYYLVSLWSGSNALLLSSVNPSAFLHDSGHHRGHPLSDTPGKRASCHVSLQWCLCVLCLL